MIYIVHPDYQHFKSFVMDSKTVRKALGADTLFHFEREPRRYLDGWQPFEISFASLGTSKKAEMPDVIVRNGRLFLNEAAYSSLHTLLNDHGEFLPVTYCGQNGYLFNILATAEEHEALDAKRSIKNTFDDVQSIAFHEEKLAGVPIFRTSFDGYMCAFCSQELKEKVENSTLRGLTFSIDLGTPFPPSTDANARGTH